MNIERLRYFRKPWLSDLELINTVAQTLHIQETLIVGRQSIVILIRLADDLNRCFHTKTGRIDDSNAQLAAIALAKEREGAKEENNY
jgi:hypothetical protein